MYLPLENTEMTATPSKVLPFIAPCNSRRKRAVAKKPRTGLASLIWQLKRKRSEAVRALLRVEKAISIQSKRR